MTGYSYENELLIQCARTKVSDQRKKRILELVTRVVDWSYVLQVAAYSHTRPLLAHNLVQFAKDNLPPDISNLLQTYFFSNTQRNLLMTAELLTILETFEKNDTEILPFKGVSLASAIYDNINLREFGDLDILVYENNLHKSLSLLEQLAYVKQPIEYDEHDFVQRRHHYILIQEEKKVAVELHWGLADVQHSSSSSASILLRNAQYQEFKNRQMLMPSSEDLLLYLCMHGYRHEWERLSWIVDVCELLRVETNLDWHYITKVAKAERNWRKLALGLKLAHKVADGDLSDSILARAPLPTELESYVEQIWQKLFLVEKPKPVGTSDVPGFHFETLKYHLIMSDTASDRLRYLRYYFNRWLTPMSGDRAVIHLPKQISFLYVPIRLIRLIGTYGFATLRTTFFKSSKSRTEN